MAIKPRRAGNKNPPMFSHEFVTQNHADIVACMAMVFVLGLVFQVTSPLASLFITLHHNATRNETNSPFDEEIRYTAGWKDSCAVFFYTLIAVVLHALVQEYVLDKITKKLHLSKIRHSKFNDAGQLFAFSLITTFWGSNIILRENYLGHISLLWDGFPHDEMNFVLKFFFLSHLSYWLHWLPEIYFQRMKKDEIPLKVATAGIYFTFIALAYLTSLTRVGTILLVLHFIPEVLLNLGKLCHFASEKDSASTWLFRIGNVVFILARFLSFIFAVLTFWFGLEPFATQALRILGLVLVGGLQSYLLFQFSIFHVKRLRSSVSTASHPKSPKKTKKSAKDVSDLPEVDQNIRKQAQVKKLKQK